MLMFLLDGIILLWWCFFYIGHIFINYLDRFGLQLYIKCGYYSLQLFVNGLRKSQTKNLTFNNLLYQNSLQTLIIISCKFCCCTFFYWHDNFHSLLFFSFVNYLLLKLIHAYSFLFAISIEDIKNGGFGVFLRSSYCFSVFFLECLQNDL